MARGFLRIRLILADCIRYDPPDLPNSHSSSRTGNLPAAPIPLKPEPPSLSVPKRQAARLRPGGTRRVSFWL